MPDRKKPTGQTVISKEFLARLEQTHTRSVDERIAAGKELRSQCSRKAQAAWNPPADRADPVDLLIENSQGRIRRLIPIRYGRMAADPFAFYRGAAAIMAYDLSHTPSTGLKLQICGDCHLLNFGGFATAERKLIFDINDFDETSIAPWEWDVKRLAASFVVAGRSNGFKDEDNREAARLAAQSYRQATIKYAGMPLLKAWYHALDLETIIARIPNNKQKRYFTKKLERAKAQSDHEKEFARLTYLEGDTPRIIDQPPLIFHYGDASDAAMLAEAKRALARYIESLPPERHVLMNRYELVDTALKVVGVGSVGTICGIALFISGNGDPLFIQVKQARQSVLEALRRRQSLRPCRTARGHRTAVDAGGRGYVPGLVHRNRTPETPILCPPTQRRQDQAGGGDDGSQRPEALRPAMRVGPGAGTRPLWRRNGFDGLYGQE